MKKCLRVEATSFLYKPSEPGQLRWGSRPMQLDPAGLGELMPHISCSGVCADGVDYLWLYLAKCMEICLPFQTMKASWWLAIVHVQKEMAELPRVAEDVMLPFQLQGALLPMSLHTDFKHCGFCLI